MDTRSQRRSDRIHLAVPIHVTGTDVNGEVFAEEAETRVLTRHGATVVLKRMLAPQQEIVIRHLPAGEEAEFRVVGQIGGRSEGYVYGVTLVDPTIDFWRINFPPLTESAKAAGRVLLQCGGCGERQVVYLDELEAEVFGMNRNISWPCQRCRETTLWAEAHHEAPSKRDSGRAQTRPERKAPPAHSRPRTQNERKHARVRTKLTACVRQAGLADEVVHTENVSRGGFRFKSRRRYLEGSEVQVAVPYAPESANIFVPARVAYAVEKPSEGLTEYAVAYYPKT